jgi:hypothetical protein
MHTILYIVTYLIMKINKIWKFFFPFDNIIIMDKSTFKLYYLYFSYYLFILFIKILDKIIFFYNIENYINNIMIKYNVIFKCDDFYLSEKFIINREIIKKREFKGNIIDSVSLCLKNNEIIDITKIIKNYTDTFPIIIFLIINDLNSMTIDTIKIKIFSPMIGFKETKKDAKEYLHGNIGDLWNL